MPEPTGDPALVWDHPSPAPRRIRPRPAPAGDHQGPVAGRDRVTLRAASDRFGVSVGTLRRWAREGRIEAHKDEIARPPRWMVAPDSVAAVAALRAEAPPATAVPARPRRTGPTDDGTAMLVPRDAWDRLMDQLGNLHEAGKALAEARERAARAETEATFLRERLSDLRGERDRLRSAGPTAGPGPEPAPGPESLADWWRLRPWTRGT